MPFVDPTHATRAAIDRIDRRIGKMATEREALIKSLAEQEGFSPCMDCFNGYCSMNCSSAPGYIKIYI